MPKRNGNKSDDEISRRKFEALLKKMPSAPGSDLSETDMRKLIHELEVHQIELKAQNDELRQAWAMAETANHKYVELFDLAPSGYFSLAVDGEIIDLNHNGAKMLGNESSRLVGLHFPSFVSVDTKDVFHVFLGSLFSSRVSETCEVTLSVKGHLPMHVHLTGIMNDNGVTCLITAVDFTERKQAGLFLEESELRYRTLANSGQALIWTSSPDKKCNYFNQVWLDFTGRTIEQELGDGWAEGVHPGDIERCVEIYVASFDQRIPFSMVYRLRSHDGSYRWILDDGKPRFDSQGNFLGYIGHCLDITERMQAEQILSTRLRLAEYSQFHSRGELQQKLLDELELLTDSNIGFFHVIDPDQVTLTLQSWSTNTLAHMCSAESTGQHYGIDKAGVWVDCVRQRKPVIHNDYYSLPHRKGLPEGHAPVMRQLVVPVFRNEMIVAIVGIGNKRSDYTEKDVEVVSLLADLAWDITEHKGAEERLYKLSQAVKQSPVIVYITNLDGIIEYANPKATEVSGYSNNELVGRNPRIFSSGEKPKEEYKTLWKAISSGQEWKGEFHNRKKTGGLYWVAASISPVFNSVGEVTHYLAVEEDITERKNSEKEIHELNLTLELRIAERTLQLAESNAKLEKENAERLKTSRALQESLDRLNKIADRLPGVVYQYRLKPDGSACFPYASEGIYDIFRVCPADVEHDASIIFSRLHPDDIDSVVASIQESAKEMSLWRHEYRVRYDDGNVRWLLGNAMPQHEADDSVLWYGFITDITEQKLAEEELKQVSSRLALATRAAGVGVWDYTIASNTLIWDDQMYALYGLAKENFSGAYEAWKSGLHPDDAERGDREIQMAIRGEKDFDTQFRVVWPNGTVRNIRAVAVVHFDTLGKPEHMLGTNWDITAQKQTEEEIRKAKSEAEKANLAKSEFLSRMSHELRTPMNSILGYAQLMQMGELTPNQPKSLNRILSSGKHLLNLIDEVLDISHIESGKFSLLPEPVQLKSVIMEVMDTVQVIASARQLKLELENSPGNELIVASDRKRLKQVLINLLNNAVKFNRQGGSVLVKTELLPPDDAGISFARISVTDTGLGILPGDIPKLFVPFGRIVAEQSQTEGTGLGLAIIKKIMEAMEGHVGVESQAGEGSTFWIDLPMPEKQLRLTEHRAEPGIPADDAGDAVIKGMVVTPNAGTILYIEDNVANAELVKEIIEIHRPETHFVTSMFGKHAVRLAINNRPDLIFLDLNLPDIKGSAVLANLLADETTKSIPVVILTADATQKQIEKLMTSGARDYLTKPLDIMMFLRVVDEWLKVIK